MPARRTAKHPLNPRTAVVYFSLVTEDYNIDEDASEGDEEAEAILRDPRRRLDMEFKALKNLSRMFGTPIDNEGHDRMGDLVCKFGVDNWAEVKAAQDVVEKHYIGSGSNIPEIDVGVRYLLARDFRLYPDGVNNRFYGEERGAAGTWEEWLKANKPAATRSRAATSKRKNPSGPRRDAYGRFVRSRR